MYNPNFHIVSIDEGSYNKTASGLYYFKMGQDSERYLQNATIEYPIKGEPYKQGDKVYVYHYVLDAKVSLKGNTYRAARPEDILCKVEEGQLISHQYIIAEKTFDKDFLGKNVEVKNRFKVLYSPFEEMEEGDVIYIAEDSDYPVEEINCTFIMRNYVLKNETKNTMLNDFIEVEEVAEDKFNRTSSGLFIPNEDFNYSVGRVGDKKYYYEKESHYRIKEGHFATKQLLVEL
jgi:hypothetical protein